MVRVIGVSMVFLVATLWAGCSTSRYGFSEEDRYYYSFFGKGCQTGEHVFQYKASFCVSLTDEELNHNCALIDRKNLHEDSKCQYGKFAESGS